VDGDRDRREVVQDEVGASRLVLTEHRRGRQLDASEDRHVIEADTELEPPGRTEAEPYLLRRVTQREETTGLQVEGDAMAIGLPAVETFLGLEPERTLVGHRALEDGVHALEMKRVLRLGGHLLAGLQIEIARIAGDGALGRE